MRPAALLIVACSALALAGQTSTPVTIKRTFKQGAVEKYTQVVQTESESSPVPIDAKVTSQIERTYDKVDDKGAEFSMKTVSISMEPDQGVTPPKPSSTGRIDLRGIFSNVQMQMDGAPAAMNMFMSAATQGQNPDGIVLPDKPVKPGDTWTFTLGAMKAINADGDMVYTFRGEKELEGKPYWFITGAGSFTLKGKADGAGDSPMSAMKGTVEQTVEAYVDKVDGSIVKVVSKGTSNLSVPGAGMEINLRTTITQTRG